MDTLTGFDEVRRLIALQTGDEKHEAEERDSGRDRDRGVDQWIKHPAILWVRRPRFPSNRLSGLLISRASGQR